MGADAARAQLDSQRTTDAVDGADDRRPSHTFFRHTHRAPGVDCVKHDAVDDECDNRASNHDAFDSHTSNDSLCHTDLDDRPDDDHGDDDAAADNHDRACHNVHRPVSVTGQPGPDGAE